MKKQVCDYCGEEIDFELGYDVSVYDHIKEDNEFQADICEKCKKKILKFLKDKEGLNTQVKSA